jgi:hypothetical protein
MAILGTFFMTALLPFILVFVVMFAVLQKSKVLGENVQVDAMVAFVIGLILIGFPKPRDMIVEMMPLLALGIAVLLIFFILYGFVSGDLSKSPTWMKGIFGALAGVYVLWIVLRVTGLGNYILSLFEGAGDSGLFMGFLMILLIIGAAVLVIWGSKKSEK